MLNLLASFYKKWCGKNIKQHFLLIPTGIQSPLIPLTAEALVELFCTWLEGRFDNYLQLELEALEKVNEQKRHIRLHSIFSRVKLPWLGTQVFYVKQYKNNISTNISRERLYSVEPLSKTRLRVRIFIIAGGAEIIRDAHLYPEKINLLTPDLIIERENCAVIFDYNAEKKCFEGAIPDGGGTFKTEKASIMMHICVRISLSETELQLDETLSFTKEQAGQGKLIYTSPGGIPSKLLKVEELDFMYQTNEKYCQAVQFSGHA